MLPGNHDRGERLRCALLQDAFGPLNSSWEIAGIRRVAPDTNTTDPSLPRTGTASWEVPAMDGCAMSWPDPARDAPPSSPTTVLSAARGPSCDVANAEECAGTRGSTAPGRLLRARAPPAPEPVGILYAAPPLSTSRESIGVPSGFL